MALVCIEARIICFLFNEIQTKPLVMNNISHCFQHFITFSYCTAQNEDSHINESILHWFCLCHKQHNSKRSMNLNFKCQQILLHDYCSTTFRRIHPISTEKNKSKLNESKTIFNAKCTKEIC